MNYQKFKSDSADSCANFSSFILSFVRFATCLSIATHSFAQVPQAPQAPQSVTPSPVVTQAPPPPGPNNPPGPSNPPILNPQSQQNPLNPSNPGAPGQVMMRQQNQLQIQQQMQQQSPIQPLLLPGMNQGSPSLGLVVSPQLLGGPPPSPSTAVNTATGSSGAGATTGGTVQGQGLNKSLGSLGDTAANQPANFITNSPMQSGSASGRNASSQGVSLSPATGGSFISTSPFGR